MKLYKNLIFLRCLFRFIPQNFLWWSSLVISGVFLGTWAGQTVSYQREGRWAVCYSFGFEFPILKDLLEINFAIFHCSCMHIEITSNFQMRLKREKRNLWNFWIVKILYTLKLKSSHRNKQITNMILNIDILMHVLLLSVILAELNLTSFTHGRSQTINYSNFLLFYTYHMKTLVL